MSRYSEKLSVQSQRLFEVLSNTVPQPRVGQLDASILDGELVDLLKNQLWKIFTTIRPDIKDNYENELLLFLKLLIFKLTVWDHSATYGAKLQNLKFVDGRVGTALSRPLSQAQKLGYATLVVGGEFLWGRLERKISEMNDYSGDYDSRSARLARSLRKFSDFLSSLWSISSLANFLLFLYTGRYSTLILRLLRIRLVPASRTLTRQVNFEFQNRQLVWNAFTEFLLFIVPILNLPKLKRRATKLISQGFGSSTTIAAGEKGHGELYFLPERTCPICYQGSAVPGQSNNTVAYHTEVTNPYEANECGHIYCYVCITTKLLENSGEGWNCLRCSTTITKAKAFVDVNPNAIAVSPLVMKDAEEMNTAPNATSLSNVTPSQANPPQESDESGIESSEDNAGSSESEAEEFIDDDPEEYDEEGEISEEELESSGFVVADEDF